MPTALHRRAVVAALAVTVAAPVLVGCAKASSSSGGTVAVATKGTAPASNGLEDLSPQEILARAKAAVLSVSSLHVKGTAADAAVDASLGRNAARLALRQRGGSIEVLAVAGVYYMKADKAFWTAQANAAVGRLLSDKYVKVTGAQAAEFKTFLTLKSFADDTLKPTGTPTKGTPTTVDGTRVIPLVDGDGTLYVSLEGTPYPVKIENAKGADKGVLTFDGWNEPVVVQKPPASQVIDLAKLSGG